MTEELKPANQYPDFGKVCIHGSLKRQCYTCELEGNNDFLKQGIQVLKDEIDRLKEQNRKMREELMCCKLKIETIRDIGRTIIEQCAFNHIQEALKEESK